MTTRDRTVIMVVLALAAMVAGWLLVVSPKRQPGIEHSAPRSRASSPSSPPLAARWPREMSARTAFAGQYAQLARLGEAVPPRRRHPVADLPGPERGAGGPRELPRPAAYRRRRAARAPSTSSSSSRARVGQASSSRFRRARPSAPAGLPTEQFTFTLSGNFFNLVELLQPRSGLRGQRATSTLPDQRPADDASTRSASRPAPTGSRRSPPTSRRRPTSSRRPKGPSDGATAAGPGTTSSQRPDLHVRILDLDARRDRHPGAAMSVLPQHTQGTARPQALADRPRCWSSRSSRCRCCSPRRRRPTSSRRADRSAAVLLGHDAARDLGPDHRRGTRTSSGKGRNPFTPQIVATTSTTTTTATTTVTTTTTGHEHRHIDDASARGGSSAGSGSAAPRSTPLRPTARRRPHRRPPSRPRPSRRPRG